MSTLIYILLLFIFASYNSVFIFMYLAILFILYVHIRALKCRFPGTFAQYDRSILRMGMFIQENGILCIPWQQSGVYEITELFRF